MRNGMVLIELLLVAVVLALLAAMTAPSLASFSDRLAVHDEASRLMDALEAGRSAAIRLSRPVSLVLGDSSYVAVAAPAEGEDSLIAWRAAGPALSAVTLRGATGSIVFGPAGLAIGASNRTLQLTRGAATRSVIVSRLGRITY